MGAQCDIRAGGRLPVPERVGDPACRCAAIKLINKHGKQFALLAPTKVKPLPRIDTCGKRTEDAKRRFPGRRHDAGFHQVSLSAPLPRWVEMMRRSGPTRQTR